MARGLEDNPSAVLNEAPGQPGILEEAEVPSTSVTIGNQCIRLVKHVESFQADLRLHAFGDRQVLEDGHVRSEVSRPCKVISAGVSVAELVAGKVFVAD